MRCDVTVRSRLHLVPNRNGLPDFTFDLKNNLTKQTVDDALWQYRKDRNSREKLFDLGRCVAHFTVDEKEAHP